MFSKRVRKSFPPGTFIPKPARVMAILQLCMAFTLLFGAAGYPFMGELFAHKSETLLYHVVMGNDLAAGKADDQRSREFRGRLERNAQRFAALADSQKAQLIRSYDLLQAKANSSFLEKLQRSLHIIAFELPALERAWILFSVIIAIMLLLRIEGAATAVWILPFIAALYGLDNHQHGSISRFNQGEALFPSEETIVNEYLKHPIQGNIAEQQERLKMGWRLYLIHEWAHQPPSNDPLFFAQQAEEGEFLFDLARLKEMQKHSFLKASPFQEKEPFGLLMIYLIWNIAFAWTAARSLAQMQTFKQSGKVARASRPAL